MKRCFMVLMGILERWPLTMSYLGSKLKPVNMSIGVAQHADNE